MGKVEKLEADVRSLSPEEVAAFRQWFLEFDWTVWDAQLERDARGGRLDVLAEAALAEHASRKTSPL